MPICIECRYPVPQLYHVSHSRSKTTATSSSSPSRKPSTTTFANATQSAKSPPISPRGPPVTSAQSKSLVVSSDVRLTQCPRCKRFADKYVEHDYVVIFIDLVLIKPQVYRHILFNRFSHNSQTLDPAIRRLGTLLILFDVYLTMIHIERQGQPTSSSPIFNLNVFLQWGFFVFVCFSSAWAQHTTIRSLAKVLGLCGMTNNENGDIESTTTGAQGKAPTIQPPPPPTPSAISTALFVSSCMSLFPILMIVWRSPEEASTPAPVVSSSNSSFLPGILLSPGEGVDWVRRGVMYAVAVQNLEALRILLGCGYVVASILVLAGSGVRYIFRSVLLGLVGMNES